MNQAAGQTRPNLEPNPQLLGLGISACLMGRKVRYDGGHKHDHYLTDILGKFVRYIPVCPEVECGLGTPREAMRLVGDPDNPRLLTTKTGLDHTERLKAWAKNRLEQLESDHLCGFVFKSRSPSSGLERVKVYQENGIPVAKGVGIFARAFMERFPWLPVEEEGRLNNPRLRENFIERIFVYQRWRDTVLSPMTLAALVDFHSRHKLLLMSHGQAKARQLGRIVAQAHQGPLYDSIMRYQDMMMKALKQLSTAKKQCNVLQHALGYFKKDIDALEKAELLKLIEQHAQGHVPLIAPVTLLNHYIRKYPKPYLASQCWPWPQPLELAAPSHV